MTVRIYAIILGLCVLAAGFLVFAEHPATSGGPVSERHAELDLACRSCHSPFQGTTEGCVSCHGVLPEANHHADVGLECADCHSEHEGPSLTAHAGGPCSDCHAPIAEETAHAVGGTMVRPEVEHSDFSHTAHFYRDPSEGDPADDTCSDCHLLASDSDSARAFFELPKAVQEIAGAKDGQLLRWSGCEDCHDDLDWEGAGFDLADGIDSDAELIPLPPARISRLNFSHSEEHLDYECQECHVGIVQPEGSDVDGEADLQTCFECHDHDPQLAGTGSTDSVTECMDCHEFHGVDSENDFPGKPDKDPQPDGWDVLGRAQDLTFTPWLVLFLIVSSSGWVLVYRRLPESRLEGPGVDPDVAPQRVPEVPNLSPNGETSVSGLYIIGELAGVPLVNRAMKSGFDVIDLIKSLQARDDTLADDDVLDVVIAGSGPAGLGAATRAKHVGLKYAVCEKSTAAATIRDYPRAKIIQAAPVDIPDYGGFFQEDDESKEALVRRWEDIITRTGVVISEREEVTDIRKDPDAGGNLVVEVTGGKTYRTRNAVLAIGMRGTPRRLGVDGEEPSRVAYGLIDAEEYREKDILVVGGGNAAVEAALALSQPALLNRVSLAIRGPVLKGITPINAQNADEAASEGQFEIVPSSKLLEIREGSVLVKTGEEEREIKNVQIFAMIGAELPTRFLKSIGVKLVRKG